MPNNRLKKGQVDPKNPHATSVRGPKLLKTGNVNNVSILGSKHAKQKLVSMTVKPIGSDKEETIQVVNPSLGVKNDAQLKNVYVRLEKDEVRFMDADKLTYALGGSIFGFDFSASKHLVLYKLYATSDGWNIYKVDVEKL